MVRHLIIFQERNEYIRPTDDFKGIYKQERSASVTQAMDYRLNCKFLYVL